MTENHDKDFQMALLQPTLAEQNRRLRDWIVVLAIIGASGWITVALICWLTK